MKSIVPNLKLLNSHLITSITSLERSYNDLRNTNSVNGRGPGRGPGPGPGPLLRQNYDSVLNSLDDIDRANNISNQYIDKIKQEITKSIYLIDKRKKLVEDTKLLANNTQLKYGLQGQLKQDLRSDPGANLTKEEREMVNEQIVPVPYEPPAGGRKTRRHRKRKYSKKKSRSEKKLIINNGRCK